MSDCLKNGLLENVNEIQINFICNNCNEELEVYFEKDEIEVIADCICGKRFKVERPKYPDNLN